MLEKKKKLMTYGSSSEDSMGKEMATLVAEMLHGATKIHFAHLKNTSYSAHMALGEFYEAIPGPVGEVAEHWQGVTEKLLEYPQLNIIPITTTEEAIAYLRNLHSQISNFQENCHYSEIINELDIVKSQIDSTKYKLIFLM